MDKLKATIKGAFKSFTIWFNGIMAAALALVPAASAMLPQLQGAVPDQVYKWLMLTTIIGNFVLRVKTDKPLHEK